MKSTGLIAVIWASALLAAQADLTWRVDFNNATPSPTESGFIGWSVPTVGTAQKTQTFANVDGGPAADLKVTLAGQLGSGGVSNWSVYNRSQAGASPDLYRDGIQFTGTNVGGGLRVSLSQLTPNTDYKVTLWFYDYQFGSGGAGLGNTQTYYNVTDGGNSLIGSIVAPPNSNNAFLPTSLTDYTVAATLTSSSSGLIEVLIDSTLGQNEKLNALEVQIVPEPSVAALIGFGALAALLLRRRRGGSPPGAPPAVSS